MYDDPYQLRILSSMPFASVLHGRDFYGGTPVFTPLLIASRRIDVLLFGIDAAGSYWHQLIALSLLVALHYAVLRLWCSTVAAFCGVAVMLAGSPLMEIVPCVMERHYLEGAACSMASVILFVLAMRRDRMSLALASGVMYFLGACAKELYVLLPLFLLAIPELELRRRVRLLIPHGVAAAVYGMWRLMAIGFDVEPYGFVAPPGQRAQILATLPVRVVRQLAGSGSVGGWAMVAIVLLAVVVVFVRNRRARLPVAAGLIIAVLPLLPVAVELERRYAFALWLLAASTLAFLPALLGRLGTALCIVGAVASLASFRLDWPEAYRMFMRMSDEARVLALLGSDDIVLHPASPPTTMLEVQKLTGTRAKAFYDELPLCDLSWRVGRVFEYDRRTRQMVEMQGAAARRACATIVIRPMDIRIDFEPGGTLHWRLGPYRDGSWMFILADGVVGYPVPSEGRFRREGYRQFKLRVRYISPQGWRTYSPLLDVMAGSDRPIVYRR